MKSVVCNVFGAAIGVACLALVLNRPAEADEKKATEQTKRVVVVKVDNAEGDVAEALNKVLQEKLKGLPDAVKKKIRQELKAVTESKAQVRVRSAGKVVSAKEAEKKAGSKPVMIELRAIGIGADGKEIRLDGTKKIQVVKHGKQKVHAIRVVAEKRAKAEAKAKAVVAKRIVAVRKAASAKKSAHVKRRVRIARAADATGKAKTISVTICVDEDEGATKDGKKSYSVTIDGDKILVNGKPIKAPLTRHAPHGKKHQVPVRVAKDGDAKKCPRCKMIFMSDDGKILQFGFDIDVDVDHVIVGKPGAGKGAAKKMQIHALHLSRTKKGTAHGVIKIDPKGHPQHVIDVMKLHKSHGPHAAKALAVFGAKLHKAHSDDVHDGVTKRLKGIEAELKKIRKLLEQMKDDDDD